jgi:hypothetical protein
MPHQQAVAFLVVLVGEADRAVLAPELEFLAKGTLEGTLTMTLSMGFSCRAVVVVKMPLEGMALPVPPVLGALV